MTAPTLETIALTVMRAMHDNDTFQPYPDVLRRAVEALRSVAPQSAKEEVRRSEAYHTVKAALKLAKDYVESALGRDATRVKYDDHTVVLAAIEQLPLLETALAPYLDAGRERCHDSVRLQLLADQLARNFAVSFFNTGNGVQLFSAGFLNGEGKDFRAAIDAAAAGMGQK